MKKNKNRRHFHLAALFLAVISLLLSGFSFLNASAILTDAYQSRDREKNSLNSIDVKGARLALLTDETKTNRSYPVFSSKEVSESDFDDDFDDDLDMTPEFKFNLSKGEILLGKEKISGSVKDANEVIFYAIRDGSIDPKYYLGKAKEKDDDKWALEFDFSNLPNDRYKIAAEVKNEYGKYFGGSVVVAIKNEISEEPLQREDSEEQNSKDNPTNTTKDATSISLEIENDAENKEATEKTEENKETVKEVEENAETTEEIENKIKNIEKRKELGGKQQCFSGTKTKNVG